MEGKEMRENMTQEADVDTENGESEAKEETT